MQKQIVLFKLLLCLLFIVMIKTNSYAQTGLNFQGVARSSNNVIIASQQISLRLSILQGSATGNVEYSETRKVTTNAQGLFAVVIGDADATSTIGIFNTINWKNTPKYLKIEMDANAGNNYTTIGTTQFQYVAYAQFASSVDAENIGGVVPVARGGTGATNLTTFKSSLVLDKINNTSDADKPISTKTQTALDLKLNAADTSKYTKQSYTDAALLTKFNLADTGKYTKQVYIDSSLVTKLKLSDTASMLSNRIGKDTLNLSARINAKANTSDVNTFLALKANASEVTTSLLSKLNKTDTSYLLQKADTATLSNRINLKANASDVNTSLGLKANASDVATSLSSKVDKITGKELSTNDYSNAEKAKLAAITGTNTGDQDLSSYATNTALALKANASDVNTSLGLKANASDVTTSLSSKVDKVTGKELSTNDFSDAEKAKLAAITGTNTGDQDLSSYATNTALALKANTADVNTALGLKANASDVTTSLALKENISNKSSAVDLGGTSPSDILYPTQKAVKDYVTANASSGGVADGGITTIKLADGAVTDAKLASGISKSKVGLGSVENTALSTWAGSNNLTTVGTITSGIWSGTAIALSNGGTGATNAAQARANLGLVIGTDVQAPLVAGTDYQIPLTAGTSYIVPNSSITAKTKIKITYDSKGLITAGSDASTADIAPSTDRNYVTDVQSGVISNTSGINTGDETTSSIKSKLGITTLSGSNTGDQTNVTGNAGTATKLATARNINDVPFDGTSNITITADAGTLSGTTLNSTVTGSSLTSVGTLANLTVTNPIVGSITGNAATATSANSVTTNANLTGPVTSVGNTTSIANGAITNAMLANLAVANLSGTNTGDQTTVSGNAGTATKLATARNINDVPFDGTSNIIVTADAGTLSGTTLKSTITGSSLTTVGTITSGVWSATTVAVNKGGTGLTSTGTNGQVLTSTGSGTLTWTTPVFLPTIVIGTQQWMRENLDVMTYRNGDVIPQVTDATAWAGLTTGAWCYYNNDPLNGAIYGKLYNWYAVNDPRGLAPQGWHIPTDAEWTTLGTLLGVTDGLGYNWVDAGGKMKTPGITRWTTPNTSATNESGFAGLPGGYRYAHGPFNKVSEFGEWWSATETSADRASVRSISYNNSTLWNFFNEKKYGFSVRCLRD